jgi:hypothetical protein
LLKLARNGEKDNYRSSRAPSLKLWRKRLGSSFFLDEERNKEIKAVKSFATLSIGLLNEIQTRSPSSNSVSGFQKRLWMVWIS